MINFNSELFIVCVPKLREIGFYVSKSSLTEEFRWLGDFLCEPTLLVATREARSLMKRASKHSIRVASQYKTKTRFSVKSFKGVVGKKTPMCDFWSVLTLLFLVEFEFIASSLWIENIDKLFTIGVLNDSVASECEWLMDLLLAAICQQSTNSNLTEQISLTVTLLCLLHSKLSRRFPLFQARFNRSLAFVKATETMENNLWKCFKRRKLISSFSTLQMSSIRRIYIA